MVGDRHFQCILTGFMALIVIVTVSFALLLGMVWGIYGKMGPQTEGFILAVAGGALVVSVVSELIDPAVKSSSLTLGMSAVMAGALVFAAADWWIDEKWGATGGGGLLAAITLDGIPENLALGVALIGTGPKEVAALAGSILLSNLPEAAGGAKGMLENGQSKKEIVLLWTGAALLLSAAAWAGNATLKDTAPEVLAFIRCFAAGAVLASLATEVFPKAFRKDHHWAGVATGIGLVMAYALGSLGKH